MIAADAGREHRQLHIMDADGRVAAHTGSACIDWKGHIQGTAFPSPATCSRARKCSTTPQRHIDAMSHCPFPRRLIAAMQAGEAAGGDKRGKQSAALLIYGEEDWPDLDLRVDDHTDPLAELARLERVSRERWTTFRRFLPNRRDPVGTYRPHDHRAGNRTCARRRENAMSSAPLIDIAD